MLWLIGLNVIFIFLPWYWDNYVRSYSEQLLIKNQLTVIGDTIIQWDTIQREVKLETSVPILQSNGKFQSAILDLNKADSLDLIGLYGVGPTIASRILKFRKALGGFISKEQLRDVYGISDDYLESILESVVVNEPANPWVEINHFDFKQLLAHPYISYELAGDLLNLRRELGWISGVETFDELMASDTVLLNKALPYFLFD